MRAQKRYHEIVISAVYESTVTSGCEVEVVIYGAWEVLCIRKALDASYPFAHCSLLDIKSISSSIVIHPEVSQVVTVCKTIDLRTTRWFTQPDRFF
uniref:Uncharacterized protein n=1 Tax=Arundo donax TaxID=35708 RepID=A0A0A8YK74_ARUDO